MPGPSLDQNRRVPPRCAFCGEVIGVYEPLMHVGDQAAAETSRAAEPGLEAHGLCYHVLCYEMCQASAQGVDR